jgi:hypothetical protein
MVGHASAAITPDRYGHLYPVDVHLYGDRLGRVAIAAAAEQLRTRGDRTFRSVPREEFAVGL